MTVLFVLSCLFQSERRSGVFAYCSLCLFGLYICWNTTTPSCIILYYLYYFDEELSNP